MDKIIIEGGIRLQGEVAISGSKNAALPIISACMLTGGWHSLENIPRLRDIETIKEITSHIGVAFEQDGDRLRVNSDNLRSHVASYRLVKTMRASVLVLGPLLSRLGKARISLPGGCAIGERPIDLHLKALRAMGVDVNLEHGYVVARADRIRGADITFAISTVTGTENMMMAAVRAEGVTTLHNAAKEPEVVDLANFLNLMGARIEGAGTNTITITGVRELHPISSGYSIIPDRIESGTLLIAAAITKGRVRIKGCNAGHIEAIIHKLQDSGMGIEQGGEDLVARGNDHVRSVDITTMPFPGFPTDMQAQFMALMCLADGLSVIRETIFENRFMHVSELRRMGADIQINGGQAVVKGTGHLSGAQVMATDLRASASLVLAGLAAQGRTEVSRVYHLDRGYQDLDLKLSSLGARIWREKH
ncbi:MAG: UDP-N-acetylglucosamine 1-carboxyvinyltransferase [Deltaproteobacteria bacterium]|nr:UDP-N-acetylglucosamine 1-carboxyvinyltransferase [Deltaproteobacteria bacterium]MBW2076063.1 UDP-N-acetylglucosamine 1-carboxyvinyltransferase [Deltaproteobacteria bacterium]